MSDIINNPSTVEKLRAKYKAEIPRSFYIEDAAQNSTSEIRSTIKDWCMRAIQCTCFKNSYYKPKMTPQNWYDVEDAKGNILCNISLNGVYLA